ncbi:hypothetical protein C8J57DRAFT_228277 [Mycena rebaudengoi]|nr:hypothetical protein C8J57DRAFT_228277 [Mycena rebaudengoi]
MCPDWDAVAAKEIALAPREVQGPKLLRRQNLSPSPHSPRPPPRTPPLVRCHHPDARIVRALSCTLAVLGDLSQLLSSLVPDSEAFCWVGDGDGRSRVLRSDHEWAPHITTTTPVFRDAVILRRPRIFVLVEEEREETRPPPQPPPSSVTPAHLVHLPRCSRRCSSLPALPPPRTHRSPTTSLPRPFIWSSAIRRGAIELLVEGERCCPRVLCARNVRV